MTEFQSLLRNRRSIRKFSERKADRALLREIVEEVAEYAPSSRNSRSTRFLIVDDVDAIARISEMRDYGSAFVKGAPCVVFVMGDRTKSDLWRENCAIAATLLLVSLVDRGLAGCWVHVDGRPRRKAEPQGEQAAEYLRTFLPIPAECEVLCAVACGYSDFTPAALPERDRTGEVTFCDGR